MKDMTPSPETKIETIRDMKRSNELFDLSASGNPIEDGWLLAEIKVTLGIDIKPNGVIGEAKWKKATKL